MNRQVRGARERDAAEDGEAQRKGEEQELEEQAAAAALREIAESPAFQDIEEHIMGLAKDAILKLRESTTPSEIHRAQGELDGYDRILHRYKKETPR